MSSPIVFESLGAESNPGALLASLPKLRASGVSGTGNRAAVQLPKLTARGRRSHVAAVPLPKLRAFGASTALNRCMAQLPKLTAYGTGTDTVPDLNYGYVPIPPGGLRCTAVGRLVNHGEGDAALPKLRAFGLSGVVVGVVPLPKLTATGYSRFVTGAAINIYQNPGYLWMPAGNPRTRITEHLALSGTPLAFAIHRLLERIALADAPRSFLEGLSVITEAVEFVDRLAAVWKMLLAETVAFEGVPSPSTLAMQRMVETLALVAGPGTSLEARNLVAETLALNDVLAVIAKEQIGDTAAFGEALSTALRARMRLLDELLVDAVPAATARVLGVLEESVALDGSPTSTLEALNRLQETIGFSISLRIGDDLYLAWVVNTETRAASTYVGYPFNSFCEFEGRYYGAAEDGIYHLDGDDDAGDDIHARIRLGMSNLGIAREKRIPALYLAYRADGRLVLKAVVTDIDGSREEWWYGLTPRGAGDVREGRIQLGRGLKAVMWDFEIANLDGADFELADLKFLPMILDRRVKGRDS